MIRDYLSESEKAEILSIIPFRIPPEKMGLKKLLQLAHQEGWHDREFHSNQRKSYPENYLEYWNKSDSARYASTHTLGVTQNDKIL